MTRLVPGKPSRSLPEAKLQLLEAIALAAAASKRWRSFLVASPALQASVAINAWFRIDIQLALQFTILVSWSATAAEFYS
ncbi:hypothetical protein ML401_38705 [Bradyrhizobium sp. 62B]|nr:hypothetical protein ML401_38705 [Bradyrhizobium sp. 62B]